MRKLAGFSRCVLPLEIPTYGRPPGSTPGCRPPLRMTRKAGMAPKVWIYAGFAGFSVLFFRLEFTLEFRRNFFSLKLIKKPSPVGEGGPRQWWMRSSREKLTYTRHLIRQPAAATFSHWRRLSFIPALSVNKLVGELLEYGYPAVRMAQTRPYVSS